MKIILFALIALATVSHSAYANIVCQAPKSTNKMNITIQFGAFPNSGFITDQQTPALVTVQGLRLFYQVKTVISKFPIQTRVQVGIGYNIELGKNYSIKLSAIRYAPVGYEHLLGFYGVYYDGVTKNPIQLKCSSN
jgi:hypothetical protein